MWLTQYYVRTISILRVDKLINNKWLRIHFPWLNAAVENKQLHFEKAYALPVLKREMKIWYTFI